MEDHTRGANMSDAALVALCRRGQSAQFSLLVERYQRLVFGLAYQMTRSREEAEDIAQESFIRVYGRIRSGVEIDFLPYIRTVATNLCLDRLRRLKSASQYMEKTSEMDVTENQTPESVVVLRGEHEMLRLALAELPEMYREVLILHYSASLSYERISEKLEQPMSIVKNRIFRGKKLLKEIYTRLGGVACEM